MDEWPCEMCGKFVHECQCAECPLCGEVGNPECYQETDLGVCGGLHPSNADWLTKIKATMKRFGYGK